MGVAALVSLYGLYRLIAPTMDFIITIVLLACSTVVVFVGLMAILGKRALMAACFLLLVLDLVPFGRTYVPFSSPEDVFPSAPVFEFLRTNLGSTGARVVPVNGVYGRNFEMVYGVRSLAGYDNVLLKARRFLAGYADGASDGLAFRSEDIAVMADRRLDLMNVRYLV